MASLAIFTRNYKQHLSSAKGHAVFRSSVRWASAARALDDGKIVDVYIANVEGDGTIEYRARLVKVLLNPTMENSEVIALLKKVPITTAGEGLWDGKVKTFYEVKDLIKVDKPFHFTDLKKLNGGQNIDAEYSRSYCIVQAID